MSIVIISLLFTCGVKTEKAADFELMDINGNMVKLSDYSDKVIILNFWAIWCPPCRMEMPDFIMLQNKYKSQGVEFIGIALQSGTVDDVKKFVVDNRINYTILMGNGDVVASYGPINNIPTTFFISKKGNISEKFVGLIDSESCEKKIKDLIK